ncbi:MAG: hydrogenase formation protein HypD [Leptolyngbya sp. PLA3]|nr:MAG: hydrogenase formation protein HypD [Cyanobacteria bacterium CYA]MCE7967771.1 hydrogenase formation protein HypD [Leptolyngbya sp. PL-A3]
MSALLAVLNAQADRLDRPISLMEVCGTHTVAACRSGIHALMPGNVRLLSGPGCPVCVTAQRYIDALVRLGSRTDVTIATYGDMIRVAGEGGSLELARSGGADVRVVTSTIEAVDIARREPQRQVVFAAVGFETTAPASAACVLEAQRRGLANFTILPCHKLVIPAMRTLLDDPQTRVDGFLCPGHVSVVIGSRAYDEIVETYNRPCVVGGFEALQMMESVLALVRQLVAMQGGERARNENLYPQVVRPRGNPHARALIDRVFVPGDSAWRALGIMKESGLDLREEFAGFDAFRRFGIMLGDDREPPGCRCGEVITGRCEPDECRLFGTVCTPIYPVGPCMVSSEGACQAWFKYRRARLRISAQEREEARA